MNKASTELFDFSGEIAVVTGGAGVLPGAMASTLLRAGCAVALWGRGSSHPVENAVSQLMEETGVDGSRLIGITVDTGKEAEVQRALDETVSGLGEPTILVNGVGGNKGKSDFVDIDIETFDEVVTMNLLAGLVIPLKAFAKRWGEKQMPGTVINIASMTSYVPLSGVWAYIAAKSATKALTEGAAREFAPQGIRVNAIAPGFFIGHQNRKLLIKDDETGELTDRGKAILNRTPFGRFGEPGDMEGTTLYLASRKASGFVTGVTIPVDGGYLVDSI